MSTKIYDFKIVTGASPNDLQKKLNEILDQFDEELRITNIESDFQMCMDDNGVWYAIFLQIEYVELDELKKDKSEDIAAAKDLLRSVFPGILFPGDLDL
jgi:hypothetical protein